jgi:uncharacterized protein (TIGR01777 family)
MKIVIPGGSGQVGTILARAFHQDGHEVVVLGRTPADTSWRFARWDARSLGDWVAEFNGADVVINLAGRSVNCRYHNANREAIVSSRVNTTRLVGEAIQQVKRPPHTWLQASTATIYAHRYDAPNDEATGIIGGNEPNSPEKWRFSIDVAKAWEKAAAEATTPHTRQVILRSAMIMSPDRAGIFDTFLWLARLGLGGAAGNGRQYVSWIHDADFIRAICWLIEYKAVNGIVNLASPNPLPQADFMRAIRAAWGIGFGLPATKWMLEMGALFMGTETELILKSRRVIPGRLLAEGFSFQYPQWPTAAENLIKRWRNKEVNGPAAH